jgi:uncharacterized protein YceK
MSRFALVLLAAGSFALGGCGTFSDVLGGPATDRAFYRGVAFDVQAAQEGGANVLIAADIPFSALADTVLVPFIAYDEWTTPRPRHFPPEGQGSETTAQGMADPGARPAGADPVFPE